MNDDNIQDQALAITFGIISITIGFISFFIFGWLAYIALFFAIIGLVASRRAGSIITNSIALLQAIVASSLITQFYISLS